MKNTLRNRSFLAFFVVCLSVCLCTFFAACDNSNNDGDKGEFVSTALDGVICIGNGSSAVPADLLTDRSGKNSFGVENAVFYNVNVNLDINKGFIKSDKSRAKVGETVNLNVGGKTDNYAAYGIKVGDLLLDGKALEFSNGKASFIMPAADVTLSATFTKKNYPRC